MALCLDTRRDRRGVRWWAMVCGRNGWIIDTYPDEVDRFLREFKQEIIGEFRSAAEAREALLQEMRSR